MEHGTGTGIGTISLVLVIHELGTGKVRVLGCLELAIFSLGKLTLCGLGKRAFRAVAG